MKPLPKPYRAAVFAAVVSLCSIAGAQTVVRQISASNNGPFQLQVQTSAQVLPQAQVITDPERLVIDIPTAVPGSGLRNQNVNRGEVERIRVGLFSSRPPVTRIVLDLKSPQWYRIAPAPSGFTVTLGANQENSGAPSEIGQTVGWVSATTAATNVVRRDAFTVRKTAAAGLPNGVRVLYDRGLLEIHARNATLSEVLFQIHKLTGAEIAIPSGTEQEHVAADLGPAPASVVLAGLLNGSDLNFVVVGSEVDPSALRSVILTHRGPGFADYIPSETESSVADNVPQDSPEIQPQVDPRPEDIPQQAVQDPQADQPTPPDQPSN